MTDEPSPGRPPRVLVVGQGPPATGGIPTFVANLMGSATLRSRAALRFLNTTPAGERRPASVTLTNAGRALRDVARVFRAARGADVVHLNVSAVPLSPLARALALCAAARAAGARTILHAHTGRLHIASRGRAYAWLLRRASLVVDVFVVVSRVEAEAAAAVGVETEAIANGIDVDRSSTGPKDDPPLIAFVGTVCERKGLIDLLGALTELRGDGAPPFRVEIVGDASQEGPGVFERVRAAYADAGADDVTFRGALAREDVDDVLARASIFCLPSHWEGLPISLLEAMAAETAPIATRVGEIPAMLDEGKAGVLVAPHDVPGLAAAIDGLLRDRDRRSGLAAAARRRARDVYGDDSACSAIADLYRRVAAYSR
ncbi:MAG TPA: glycosyltransferase family 4 protein [Actinomycetota bacterium]|jgi:glycosyltransferase involved in cell wall biosynthesis|nr:glycosyltransferase family 4 protein [Actinomycetota bacterium]